MGRCVSQESKQNLQSFGVTQEHRTILELQVIPKTERTGPAHDPLCSLAEELGHCPAGDGASRRILSQTKGCNRLMFYILQLLPRGWIREEFGSWGGILSSSLILRCPTVAVIIPMGSRKIPVSSFPCILGSFSKIFL